MNREKCTIHDVKVEFVITMASDGVKRTCRFDLSHEQKELIVRLLGETGSNEDPPGES